MVAIARYRSTLLWQFGFDLLLLGGVAYLSYKLFQGNVMHSGHLLPAVQSVSLTLCLILSLRLFYLIAMVVKSLSKKRWALGTLAFLHAAGIAGLWYWTIFLVGFYCLGLGTSTNPPF